MYNCLTCQGKAFEECPVSAIYSIATKQKVRGINYGGTLEAL